MKAQVYIKLKEGILDPQGKAVQQSLHHLGYTEVKEVRVGKLIEVVLPPMPEEKAREKLEKMCRKLLANTVIEKFHFQLEKEDS